MGLRAQEIGIEMANALSQIKLNESQASKNEAEANKIKGVDTEAQQATIDNLIAQTSNEKIKRGLIYSGQGTANLRVIWNTTGLQSISVSYVSPQGCMMPGPYSRTIFVQPLPNAAGAITGSGEVCAGESGVVY